MNTDLWKEWLTPLIVGILSGWLARPIWLMLSGLVIQALQAASLFHGLLPNVSGTWKNHYQEPDEKGLIVEASETIQFRQIGSYVWGKGHRDDEPNVQFQYRGKLIRGTLIGNHHVLGRKAPVGVGSFELKVCGSDDRMLGHCSWHDLDTDNIESSKMRMVRKQ